MKKTLQTTALIMLSLVALGQNDKSKKVKTQYLSLPSYDVAAISPTSIGIEFAMRSVVFGTEKLKDTKSKCLPKGGGLKDIVEVTAYHYEVPMTLPESYIVAKSSDGTVVYAAKSSETMESSSKFGWDSKMSQSMCEYWQVESLKKAWASQSDGFKAQEAKAYEDRIYKEAYEKAVDNVSINYVYEEFEVYGAKGKDFDYTELDAAFDKAISAYELIGEEGYNEKNLGMLKEAIIIWEKELATVDLEDKKARINKEIAKGLEENCARAYFHMLDFENAKKHASAFAKLFGNASTPRSQAFEPVDSKIRIQSAAAAKNESSLSDIAGLHAKAVASKDGLAGLNGGSANVDRLKGDYTTHQSAQYYAVVEENKKEEEAAIASGELNPYQKYYLTNVAGGEGVIMNLPPSPFSGVPELTEFPKEICLFTEAKQVMILKNKISSIPADISKMKNLEKLDLTGNQLTALPAEIGTLENLKTLKLGNNPLESLPEELANCKNLKSLVLKGSKVPADQVKSLQAKLPNCKIKS